MQDKVADAALLLKEQIAKANFVTAHGPSSVLNEERRSSSPASTSGTTSSRAALHSDTTDATRSDIIDNYFKSQSELRSQMERQYLDRLARNEFEETSPSATHTPDPPSTPRHADPFTDVTDASVLKTRPTLRENGRANPLKRKRTSTKTHPPERDALSPAGLDTPVTRLPTATEDELELDILAKLPPLDPALIAEYADFVFEPDPGPEADPDDPMSDSAPSTSHPQPSTALETDAYSQESAETGRGWAPSLERVHLPPSLAPPLEIGKIDWGSDSEEEEHPAAPCHLAQEPPRPASCFEAPLHESDGGREVERRPVVQAASPRAVLETAVELRAVAAGEVERLHAEEVLGLNGNLDKWGCWREWQETLTVETYGHEDLLILPYTVIDF